MQDGRTHLAHKAEHVVDLETGALVAVTLQGVGVDDTTSLYETLITAAEQIVAVQPSPNTVGSIVELFRDMGYHSNATVTDLWALDVRTYISELQRGRRRWTDAPDAQRSVYANRRRGRGRRGKRLLRRRGDLLERPNAHLYDTGGMRRTHPRGHQNIFKRLIVHVAGLNLDLLMRTVPGVGKPRRLQGGVSAFLSAVLAVVTLIMSAWNGTTDRFRRIPGLTTIERWRPSVPWRLAAERTLATV